MYALMIQFLQALKQRQDALVERLIVLEQGDASEALEDAQLSEQLSAMLATMAESNREIAS